MSNNNPEPGQYPSFGESTSQGQNPYQPVDYAGQADNPYNPPAPDQYPTYGEGVPQAADPYQPVDPFSQTQSPYGPTEYGQSPYGQPPFDQQQFDPQTGAPYQQPGAFPAPGYGQPLPLQTQPFVITASGAIQPVAMWSNKSKLAGGLLGIFLGGFGVHNFYLGYTGKAVAQLLITILSFGLLSWVSAIWGLIEGILILASNTGTTWDLDAQGYPMMPIGGTY